MSTSEQEEPDGRPHGICTGRTPTITVWSAPWGGAFSSGGDSLIHVLDRMYSNTLKGKKRGQKAAAPRLSALSFLDLS